MESTTDTDTSHQQSNATRFYLGLGNKTQEEQIEKVCWAKIYIQKIQKKGSILCRYFFIIENIWKEKRMLKNCEEELTLLSLWIRSP